MCVIYGIKPDGELALLMVQCVNSRNFSLLTRRLVEKSEVIKGTEI